MFKLVFTQDSVLKTNKNQSKTNNIVSKQPKDSVIVANTVCREGDHILLDNKYYAFSKHIKLANTDLLTVDVTKYPRYNQRLFAGDLNKDGRPDSGQSCNIHALAVVISGLTGELVFPMNVWEVVKRLGSQYDHAVLAKAVEAWGLTSKFSTTTHISKLHDHLAAGKPAVWSCPITHGGHIISVLAYNKVSDRYYLHDSWGEPSRSSSKWVYDPYGGCYWLSGRSFSSLSYNMKKDYHWLHLIN